MVKKELLTISDFKIRKCKKEDYRFFYNLINKTLVIPFISKYFKPNSQRVKEDFLRDYQDIKIILLKRKRIGLYQIQRDDKTLIIVKLFLIPDYQSKGVGRLFMDYFETLDYKKISLEVWDNNPAVHFYKKLGYIIIKKKKHKIHMQKLLR